MKFKSIFLTAIAALGLYNATVAQVPNYIPTNGLVSWWPFNGNANDESGNVNNGTVNGASLTTNRFGSLNKAYNFDGVDDVIIVSDNNELRLNTGDFTISLWYKMNSYGLPDRHFIFKSDGPGSTNKWGFQKTAVVNGGPSLLFTTSGALGIYLVNAPVSEDFNWHHAVIVRNGILFNIYEDGILLTSVSNIPMQTSTQAIRIGGDEINGGGHWHHGSLDDIGIWNRALTQQEITALYSAVDCANNTIITPQTNSLVTGSTANFIATTSDPNPNYVWQSDLGQGFQTLNNFGNYSGANTANLNIANIQLPNHTQPIRVISSSGNCIDTSDVAIINILDTCITNFTVYDTLLTTVTDTLIINATITGLNPPSNQNTIKVFPNPANTHITVDYGNFASMNGYTLTIVNSIGQTVFTTAINQQTSYLDLSTWTGTGIYYVQLIDTQNNTIENRKIVIQ
jgi:hypothetical protein